MPEINVESTAGMITFIEKAPWEDKNPFIGDTYYPNYMVKDGIEYFVLNRAKSESGQGVYPSPSAQLESAKATLIANAGTYFKLYGFYDNPAAMLKEIMLERGCTFTEPEDIFIVCDSPFYGGGFTDFHGNWNEVSGAFHYRIYDKALLDALRGQISIHMEGGHYD